jgi:hypothetical protein
VYKEWTTWNDFLGTENKFGELKTYRPYEEAIAFVHKQQLKTYEDWKQFCHDGKRPPDIPSRPDMYYSKWISWNHWLGNKPIELLEAKKLTEENYIFYIIREKNSPAENIFTFGIEETGYFGVLDRQKQEMFEIIKLFWYEKEKDEQIRTLIERFSTPYYGEEKKRIVPNIFDIIWYLQIILREARKPIGEKGELVHVK